MKKLLVVSAIAALGLNSVVLAGGLPEEMPMAPAAVSTSDAGIYVGIEGGFGITNWKNIDGYTDGNSDKWAVSKDNGAVGRALIGYDINRYFALEAGYTYFFNKVEFTPNNGNHSTNDARTQAIDLMAKIKAPVVDNFDLYAKLGGNYLMTNLKGGDRKNYNLAFGAGADYYITPNIIANVEWLRFNGNAKLESVTGNCSYQPSTDAFMVGLRYKFDL